MPRKGFSLAEIMITLVIIGIIASVTVPAITATVFNNQFKDGYIETFRVLHYVAQELKADNGGSYVGAFGSDTNTMMTKFCTKLSCTTTCAEGAGGCWWSNTQMSPLHGGAYYQDNSTKAGAILNTGVRISFNSLDPTCSDGGYVKGGQNIKCGCVHFDINGTNGPNTFGIDIYSICFNRDSPYPNYSKGVPAYESLGEQATLDTYCNTSSTNNENGEACGFRIIKEGSINYI